MKYIECSGVTFRDEETGPIIDISNDFASASISLYGGQVLLWKPHQQLHPVLWLSPKVEFKVGKPIRGGVPICWPWFGSHPSVKEMQSHGYARLSNWKVKNISSLANGDTEIILEIENTEQLNFGDYKKFSLNLKIVVGNKLKIELITLNVSNEEVNFSEGLHTYFHVGNIANISVAGLMGQNYHDLMDGRIKNDQSSAIRFNGEIGRVYVNTESSCLIDDNELSRKIIIEKMGSSSTAIWNPWEKNASRILDLGSNGWMNMVCVESANAYENCIKLPARQEHKLSVCYSVAI